MTRKPMTPQTTAAALQPDSGNQDAFIAAVIEAAEILRRDPLNFRHETPQGPVDLNVSSSTRGDWIARISGRQVGVMCRFGKLQHANEYLLRMFAELMPEHRCNRCCGGTQKPLSA